MKSVKTLYIIFTTVLLFSMTAGAVENPNVPKSSFGANNTVPSQGQGQRTVPQPVGSGNDVVTGNVGGMRYFRGVVPYGSTYYSGANASDYHSRSVNSFIRRSVNPVVSDRNPGRARSYYEPSQTTSAFRSQVGTRGTIPYEAATGRTRASTYDLPPLPPSQITQSVERPLSVNNQELDLILSRQFELKQEAQQQKRTVTQDRSEFERFFDDRVPRPQEAQENPDTTQTADRTDETPPLRPEEKVLQDYQLETTEAMIEQESVRKSLAQQRLEAQQAEQALAKTQISGPNDDPKAGEATDADETRSSRLMQRAEAEHIRGEHKSFQSLAEAKFADYMRAAEQFVIDGKYYKAADTYELALTWVSGDPRPYAGKAFALFAAGEYMSSAYYLSRAIELHPALASRPVNVAGLLNDRDTYENRILEIQTWQQRSHSGELALLLAYLYHHDGKADKAAAAIATAAEKMPDTPAVQTLQAVISGR